MISLTRQCRRAAAGTILLLWCAALWHGWESRGLFSDGSEFLLDMVRNHRFGAAALDPRSHVVFVTQAPVMLAIWLGAVDLHWLARLYSFVLFGVPTALYSLALWRARHDATVLATTLAAIAIVFMTTSYFIIGEYNTAYACAILAAVYLATASELRTGDGVVLVLVALLAARAYEHFVYLGPLLGTLTLISVARRRSSSRLAVALTLFAAAWFFYSAVIATFSLVDWFKGDNGPYNDLYARSLIAAVPDVRFNIQLDLLLAAVATLAAFGVFEPRRLQTRWPYLAAGLFVLLLALSPLLVVVERFVAPPYAWSQQAGRTAAGALTAAIVVVLAVQSPWARLGLPIVEAWRAPAAARRLVALAVAMLVATLPWDILITRIYSRYLTVVQAAIGLQSGPFHADGSLLEVHPRLAQHDAFPASLSLILRQSARDGVLIPEPELLGPVATFDPDHPPDLGRFVWRN
jgi:hypothetical protein